MPPWHSILYWKCCLQVLESPGTADLSAHVDFRALKRAVEASGVEAVAHGPIPQGHFLKAMGLEARLEALLQVNYWRLL